MDPEHLKFFRLTVHKLHLHGLVYQRWVRGSAGPWSSKRGRSSGKLHVTCMWHTQVPRWAEDLRHISHVSNIFGSVRVAGAAAVPSTLNLRTSELVFLLTLVAPPPPHHSALSDACFPSSIPLRVPLAFAAYPRPCTLATPACSASLQALPWVSSPCSRSSSAASRPG